MNNNNNNITNYLRITASDAQHKIQRLYVVHKCLRSDRLFQLKQNMRKKIFDYFQIIKIMKPILKYKYIFIHMYIFKYIIY